MQNQRIKIEYAECAFPKLLMILSAIARIRDTTYAALSLTRGRWGCRRGGVCALLNAGAAQQPGTALFGPSPQLLCHPLWAADHHYNPHGYVLSQARPVPVSAAPQHEAPRLEGSK